MLNMLTDVMPKAAIAAATIWAGAHYLVIGPQIAARIVRADVLPACERDATLRSQGEAESRAAALAPPPVDRAKEAAAAQLRALRDNPMMQGLEQLGSLGDLFGLDAMTSGALDDYEAAKKSAEDAYRQSLEALKRTTETDLASAGTRCACLADAAIEATRTDWALFSGSLGLVRPASIRDFAQALAGADGDGLCRTVSTEAGR